MGFETYLLRLTRQSSPQGNYTGIKSVALHKFARNLIDEILHGVYHCTSTQPVPFRAHHDAIGPRLKLRVLLIKTSSPNRVPFREPHVDSYQDVMGNQANCITYC